MAVFLTFWYSHMNNQRKCQLGDELFHVPLLLVTTNSDCHSCITLWHPHACAYAAIVEEEDTTMYLEQCSAAFNALPEVSHHSTALSGSHSLAH